MDSEIQKLSDVSMQNRIEAVKKLINACDTALDALAISIHVYALRWTHDAEMEINESFRRRLCEITGLEVA